MTRCPTGHASEAADFCSVCGREIGAAPAACPVCTTPREPSDRVVCEICGHNFRTGAGDIPGLESPPDPGVRWEVVVRADPGPVDAPPQVLTLYDAEAVVGRAGTGVRVQVPAAHDPGVSRR